MQNVKISIESPDKRIIIIRALSFPFGDLMWIYIGDNGNSLSDVIG